LQIVNRTFNSEKIQSKRGGKQEENSRTSYKRELVVLKYSRKKRKASNAIKEWRRYKAKEEENRHQIMVFSKQNFLEKGDSEKKKKNPGRTWMLCASPNTHSEPVQGLVR